MKKLVIAVAAVTALAVSGCSTVEKLWAEEVIEVPVPEAVAVVTTPLPDVVIIEVVTPPAE
jgi:outer membrane lipoprotein SlyB|tara:strand:- start:1746 stop:1928 length:183 start_codon:yes stop_codon:yes gene_type:complete